MDFSLPGTKVQRNEKARYRLRYVILMWPIYGCSEQAPADDDDNDDDDDLSQAGRYLCDCVTR